MQLWLQEELLRHILNDKKLTMHALAQIYSNPECLGQARVVINGPRKESDKELVNWLTDLNIGKDVIETVIKFLHA